MKNTLRKAYIISDILSAIVAWVIFYSLRKNVFEPAKFGYKIDWVSDQKYYLTIALITLFWFIIYLFSGYYQKVVRKNFLFNVYNTISTSAIGVMVLFFGLLLDDFVKDYNYYYYSLLGLFGLHFTFTLVFRQLVSVVKNYLIKSGFLTFNAIIVGNGANALQIASSYQNREMGENILGYIATNNNTSLVKELKCLGQMDQIVNIVKELKPDDLIIALETDENELIKTIFDKVGHKPITIKAIPELYEYLGFKPEIMGFVGDQLLEIPQIPMDRWQYNLKMTIDIIVSLLLVILLLPVFAILAIGVKLNSKGPVLFAQERVGQHGRLFRLYKFRSMYIDAEKDGPGLSKKDDDRVTPFGRFLRKYKIDELPNFFNVLNGDMSLVGPRPERQFFIDQIVKIAPHYKKLHRIKPGITSLGQVKFGYAENVEQMVKRLRYDIIYLENMSIWTDIKIFLYTIRILIKGRHI